MKIFYFFLFSIISNLALGSQKNEYALASPPQDSTYVADSLANRTHQLKVIKRTKQLFGIGTIAGSILSLRGVYQTNVELLFWLGVTLASFIIFMKARKQKPIDYQSYKRQKEKESRFNLPKSKKLNNSWNISLLTSIIGTLLLFGILLGLSSVYIGWVGLVLGFTWAISVLLVIFSDFETPKQERKMFCRLVFSFILPVIPFSIAFLLFINSIGNPRDY